MSNSITCFENSDNIRDGSVTLTFPDCPGLATNRLTTGNSYNVTLNQSGTETNQTIQFVFADDGSATLTIQGNISPRDQTVVTAGNIIALSINGSGGVLTASIVGEPRTVEIYTSGITGYNQTQILSSPIQEENNFGVANVISNDGNDLFIGDDTNNRVYPYHRNSVSEFWDPCPIIARPDVPNIDNFGRSLAVSDLITNQLYWGVGHPDSVSPVLGISQYNGRNCNYTYIGELVVAEVLQQFNFFGQSIAVTENRETVVVGRTFLNDINTIYIFGQENYTLNVDGPDIEFGRSLAINRNGRFLAVGAPRHNQGSGAVYIYVRDSFSERYRFQQLLAGNSDFSQFGETVALSAVGDNLVVGSHRDGTGRAVIYTVGEDGNWVQVSEIFTDSEIGTIQTVAINDPGDVIALGFGDQLRVVTTEFSIIETKLIADSNDARLQFHYSAGLPELVEFSLTNTGANYSFFFNNNFTSVQTQLTTFQQPPTTRILGALSGGSGDCDFSGGRTVPGVSSFELCSEGGESPVGMPDLVRAPRIYMTIQIDLTGSDIAQALFQVCDLYDYHETTALGTICVGENNFYPRVDMVTTQFNKVNPYILCAVDGVGRTLTEKILNLQELGADNLYLDPLVQYAMAKFILSRVLYGNFCIKYLLRSFNGTFFEDLANSRFCRFVGFFECPQFSGYENYFRDNIDERCRKRGLRACQKICARNYCCSKRNNCPRVSSMGSSGPDPQPCFGINSKSSGTNIRKGGCGCGKR